MSEYRLTQQQARVLMLVKQGLLGEYQFEGKPGVVAFVAQAGCIQYDPIDSCGKNAELVLQARVKGFRKEMLYDLLYEDRCLIDYYDKNLSIVGVGDWPYFSRIREYYREFTRSKDEIDAVSEQIVSLIKEKGFIGSKDLDLKQKVDWYWSDTNLSRAALEAMYFSGELVVHHKKGTIKYYALAKEYIAADLRDANEPFERDLDHMKWRVLRRIAAVGLLWNRPSDAFLGIGGMKANQRKLVFEELLQEKEIIELIVEGIKEPLYCCASDRSLVIEVLSGTAFKGRMEFLAPLDSFLWDRKLILALFGFEYKWEIYTPLSLRKHGYYVLPILWKNAMIGRIDVVHERKKNVLLVKKIWLEDSVSYSKLLFEALVDCIERFRVFHGCIDTVYADEFDVVVKFEESYKQKEKNNIE